MATYTGADKALAFLFEIAASIAEDYDDSTTYAVGAYTIYAGTLYKCISAISTPEDFDPTHWQAVYIMDEVAAGGGGGGGGTTVIANPAGTATDTLNKLQVGSTIYGVSGGGSSGHTYSTTEQIVGTWIDGKTVYEKTFTGLSIYIPVRTTGWQNTGISSIGTETIIYGGGVDTYGQFFPLQVVMLSATHTFAIAFQCQAERTIQSIIMRYTKSV